LLSSVSVVVYEIVAHMFRRWVIERVALGGEAFPGRPSDLNGRRRRIAEVEACGVNFKIDKLTTNKEACSLEPFCF
jgi:hypothetical protein